MVARWPMDRVRIRSVVCRWYLVDQGRRDRAAPPDANGRLAGLVAGWETDWLSNGDGRRQCANHGRAARWRPATHAEHVAFLRHQLSVRRFTRWQPAGYDQQSASQR